jgi:membrane associated rhomboid family serine protease
MVQASVGFQCPECVKGTARTAPVMNMGDVRRQGRPIVTEVLIGLNVFAMLAVIATGGAPFEGGGDVSDSYMLVGYNQLVEQTRFGFTATPIGVAEGEWYRIFTGGFLHAGLLHLGMNMLLLYLLGSQLEPLLGRLRFLTLYVACLVAGSFGVLLVTPTAATVGASGAVFGLMGAAVVAQRFAGVDIWRNGIGGLIVINLLLTFAVPGISIGAHLGGLVAGVAVGAVVFALDRAVQAPWLGSLVCVALTAVLLVGCVWAAEQWADPVFGSR